MALPPNAAEGITVDLSSFIAAHFLYAWIGIWTLLGGGAMAADKISARIGSGRISERALAATAFVGGFAGITLGGLLFHHKTSKGEFWVPIGASWVMWGVFLLIYFHPGILTF